MTREPSCFAASLLLLATGTMQDTKHWVVEIDAGAHAREDALVELELPPEASGSGPLGVRMELVGGQLQGVPVHARAQRIAGAPARLVWRVGGRLEAGETRRCVIEPSVEVGDRPYVLQRSERGLALLRTDVFGKEDDRDLLHYLSSPVAPPDEVDAVYTRGGYLHPLLTPSGRAVTGDFPPAHRHHHGVWTAWTRSRFEGRAIDFWNSAEQQGRVEPVEVLHAAGGPHLAHLRTSLRHVDLTAPDGERVALNEVWDVRAFALDDATVVDLELEQRCASESPLELLEYHYGGLGWRGPVGWEGDACRFLTSEGEDRLEGHATRARWCAITGEVDGEPVTAAILCHPSNFRAPQPMRLHPSEPFFCYAPEQLGPFEITPTEPYRARYRLLAMDGEPDVERIEELWRDWAQPPVVRVVER